MALLFIPVVRDSKQEKSIETGEYGTAVKSSPIGKRKSGAKWSIIVEWKVDWKICLLFLNQQKAQKKKLYKWL